jgi:spermidine/putrescine transport system substrate-binding protein
MMKDLFKFVLALALPALLAAGCGSKKPVLHVYTWSDYVKPELIDAFEKEFNCRVVIDTYDSNEAMYAKLKAGATGYDLLFPSSYMVKIMLGQGMLQKLNSEWLPNRKNLDPAYLERSPDKNLEHSVPYTATITSLGYLGSRVENFEASWAMLGREDLKGRMTMLDDYRETIGAALKYLGYSLNTIDDGELAQARDVVIGWKRNLAKFENEQYKTGLASSEFLLVHGYSGDLMQVQAENEDIAIEIPKEGSALSFDDMVIPASAREVELAHAFINYILRPDVAAELTEYIYYLCPNRPSYELLSQEIREDPILFPPDEVVANLEMIDDLGEHNAKYTRVWDEIKASE